jgi:small-conductance mechanosensitive channel
MQFLGLDLSTGDISRIGLTIGIAVLTLITMRVIARVVRKAVAANEAIPSASVLVNIARGLILAIGALTILSVFDISITPILTALGVGGLAVSLALQDTLGNLFAGLQIIASKQIRQGDYILLESGQEGTVVDVAWRTTTLRTSVDNLVIVPNATLAQSIVTNYKLPHDAVAVLVEFGVTYGSDLDKVEAVALEVAAEVVRDLEPTLKHIDSLIRFPEFGGSQVTGMAILHVSEFNRQWPMRSEFVKRLHARFNKEGIEFAFPTRTVYMADSE